MSDEIMQVGSNVAAARFESEMELRLCQISFVQNWYNKSLMKIFAINRTKIKKSTHKLKKETNKSPIST